jgi:hypothetical protein
MYHFSPNQLSLIGTSSSPRRDLNHVTDCKGSLTFAGLLQPRPHEKGAGISHFASRPALVMHLPHLTFATSNSHQLSKSSSH